MRNLMALPSKRKKPGRPRTILDRVLSKQPDFDPKKHTVLVNNIPVLPDKLDMNAGPLDIVKVEPNR